MLYFAPNLYHRALKREHMALEKYKSQLCLAKPGVNKRQVARGKGPLRWNYCVESCLS